MKYVAIEGSSYAGKTTVVSEFARKGYPVIPEYDTFGSFPPQGETLQECKNAALNFIHRERQRTALLGKITSNQFVFSDRSVFSLVAYEDMMIRQVETDAKREQHRAVQLFMIDSLDTEIQKGNIVLPDISLTLRLDSQEAFDARVKQRGVTAIRALSLFPIQQLIADKVYTYAAAVLGNHASVAIDVSSDTELEVFDRLYSIVNAIQPSRESKDITKIREIEDEGTATTT